MTPPTVTRHPGKCFLVVCRDGPDSGPFREQHLDGHLAHVEANWERYVVAGPMREPDGDLIVGSMFLVLADDLADAQSLMRGDPYITCGMYADVDYKEQTLSIGRYMGGKIWASADAIRDRATGG